MSVGGRRPGGGTRLFCKLTHPTASLLKRRLDRILNRIILVYKEILSALMIAITKATKFHLVPRQLPTHHSYTHPTIT